MSTQYHFQYKKENHPKLSQICSYGIFSKGLKNEFETAVVDEPSVFEPLKFNWNRLWPPDFIRVTDEALVAETSKLGSRSF